ncbi:MAG: extracellular solute-binding protein, partial [Anaerolineae bacterium]|nr:extracellular solute-binding protein [Anaerolineae bacterium]
GSTLTIVQKDTENLRTEFQQAALAGSGGPDMVWGPADQVGVFVAAGIVQPVDDMVDMKLFIPGITSILQFNGKYYAVPLSAGNHLMLFYNKSMVEKAPETFEDLVKVAKDLQSKNKDAKFSPFAYNQTESFWVFPFAHGFGATEFQDDGKTPVLDSEGWVKAYQLIYDLKFKDQIEPKECDYDCADGGFKNGEVAMIINGDWALGGDQGYIKKLGDKLGIAAWPKVAGGGQPAPFIAGKTLSVASTVKGDKLKTLSAFANFLTTDEESVIGRTATQSILPALSSALKNEKVTKDPILAETSKVLVTGVAQPTQPEMRCVFDAVTTQTRALMNDSIKPDAAAKEAQKVATDCIAKLK